MGFFAKLPETAVARVATFLVDFASVRWIKSSNPRGRSVPPHPYLPGCCNDTSLEYWWRSLPDWRGPRSFAAACPACLGGMRSALGSARVASNRSVCYWWKEDRKDPPECMAAHGVFSTPVDPGTW